jgi:uncharacterized membrane protein
MNKPNGTIKVTILVICLIAYAFFSTPILAMDKSKVEKSIEINAPINRVFSYTTDPKNLRMLMPNMKSVTAVSPPTAGVGQSWYWEYKWMGMTLKGKSRVVKFNPPMRYVVQSEDESEDESPPDIWIYTLSKGNTGTKVTLEINYTISSSVPAKIAKRIFIEKKIRGEVQDSLERLKTILESNKYGELGEKSQSPRI